MELMQLFQYLEREEEIIVSLPITSLIHCSAMIQVLQGSHLDSLLSYRVVVLGSAAWAQ